MEWARAALRRRAFGRLGEFGGVGRCAWRGPAHVGFEVRFGEGAKNQAPDGRGNGYWARGPNAQRNGMGQMADLALRILRCSTVPVVCGVVGKKQDR